jgi:hypothetical protein
MLSLQELESIRKKYCFLYHDGIDISDPDFDIFLIKSSFHSSQIYGCNFSFDETSDFLLSGKTAQGKDFFDYLIIQNLYDSQKWFYAKFNLNFTPQLETITELNSKILAGIEYRLKKSGDNIIRTRIVKHELRKDPLDLIKDNREERETKYLILKSNFSKLLEDIHYCKNISLRTITDFYGNFLMLRPFDMANGRTIRILINFLFFKAGFPLISFDFTDKVKYEKAISDYNNNKYNKLTEYFESLLENNLTSFGKVI